MEILFKNENIKPKVSLVLLDWTCRESFHMLDYLAKQTIARQQYEIIWIEYYSRRSPEIAAALEGSKRSGKPPIVDQWIVMDMPADVYYHKHLMYNIGIIASRGEIVTICDSDTVVEPTLVESIVKSFEENPDIVLHLDEVRNVSRAYYPFNYPTKEKIISDGCINFKDGKTIGLLDQEDPLHSRNYGSCMCALREDLIQVGGADEHLDFLGHVCGPYDLTFRLVNRGKKEIWHESEYFYHTWHPGTDGHNNYMGPHDGRNMSSLALEAKNSGRWMPLVENPAIEMLRRGNGSNISSQILLSTAIRENNLKSWSIDETKRLISMGRAAYYKSDYEKALEYWNQVLNELDRKNELLNERARAYYHQANYTESIKLFNRIIKKDPKDYAALGSRGWAHLHRNDYGEAISDFLKAVEHAQANDKGSIQESMRGLAWAYYHKKNYDKALQSFLRTLKYIQPSDKNVLQDAYRGIGWVYIKKEEFIQAKEYFKKAIENISADDIMVLEDAKNGLGMAVQSLEKKAKAKNKIKIKPKVVVIQAPQIKSTKVVIQEDSFVEKGWTNYLKANYTEALSCFNEALKLDPNDLTALRGRGWAMLQICSFKEAHEDFKNLLIHKDAVTGSFRQELFRGHGWAEYKCGNFKEAIDDFTNALNITSRSDRNALENIYKGRSWAFYRAGNIDAAINDFKKINEWDAANPWLMRGLLKAQIIGSEIKKAFRQLWNRF